MKKDDMTSSQCPIRPQGELAPVEGADDTAMGKDSEESAEPCELEDEDDSKARRAKGVTDVKKPSRNEVDQHELTHLPFKSWCRHCVRGRGVRSPHRAKTDEDDEDERVPTISIDYGFLTDEPEDGSGQVGITLLVGRCSKTKATVRMVVPSKGAGDGKVSDRLAKWIETLGHKKFVYKAGQEPSIADVWNLVKESRRFEMIPEDAEVGQSQTNGSVENAIREIKGMTTTLKSNLEERIRGKIPLEHPMMQWLVEYAGTVISRYKTGVDGETAYERIKRKKVAKPVVPIGERVLFMPNRPKSQESGCDVDPRYIYGVWVGIRARSGEALIGTPDRVWKSTSIRRLPREERWSAEAVREVKETPWTWESVRAAVTEGDRARDVMAPQVDIDGEETQRRRAQITKDVLDRFGYHEGPGRCAGCKAARRGLTSQTHSEECRRRIEEQMRQGSDKDKAKLDKAQERLLQEAAARVGRDDKRSRGEEPDERNVRSKGWGSSASSSQQLTREGQGSSGSGCGKDSHQPLREGAGEAQGRTKAARLSSDGNNTASAPVRTREA